MTLRISLNLINMRYVLTILVLAWACVCNVQGQISQVEYFLSKDPGLGNGTPVVITEGNDIGVAFDVDVSSLTPGFHVLGVRARDAAGQWSHTTMNTVLVLPKPVMEPVTLKTVEYFIDVDPGYGSGTPIATANGKADAVMALHVDLSDLTLGYHTLYVRALDSENRWSQTTANHFYVGADQIAENIVAFHYKFTATDFESDSYTYQVTVPATDVQADFTANLDQLPAPGEYTLHIYAETASGQEGVVSTRVFTVEEEMKRMEQTVTFAEIPNKTYGDANFKLVATASSGLPVTYVSSNTQVATVATDGTVAILQPGNVTITASQAGDATYFEAPAVEQSLVVEKATLTVTASDHSRTVGEQNPAFRLTYHGFVKTDDESILTEKPVATTTATQQSPVGAYPITVSGGESSLYSFVYHTGTLTVTPAARVLNFGTLPDATFGDDPIPLNASVNTGEPITFTSSNAAVATVSAQGTLVIRGAGTTTVTASVPDNAAYTGRRSISQELSVRKAAQELRVATVAKLQYGQPPFNPNFTASSGLAVSYRTSDEQVLRVTANGVLQIVGAGEVQIIGTQEGNANYLPAVEAVVKVTVEKAPLMIAAPQLSRVYGEDNPPLNPVFSGWVNEDKPEVLDRLPTLGTTAGRTTDVGTYAITVSGAVSEKYSITYVVGTLTITPAERVWVFDDFGTIVYGGSPLPLNASVSSGEAISYSSADPTVASISDGSVEINRVGTTRVTASVQANKNYSGPTSVSHDLVVQKAPQTIIFETVPMLQRRGAPHQLQVTASSGLPVSLSITDNFTAVLDGDQLTPLRVGRGAVTASQPGDENYLAAPPVVIPFSVADGNNELIRVHPAVSPDGDGINDFLIVEGIKDFPENRLTLYTSSGMRVFDRKNYDNAAHVFDGTSNVGRIVKLPQGTYYYVLEFGDGRGQRERVTGYIVLRY